MLGLTHGTAASMMLDRNSWIDFVYVSISAGDWGLVKVGISCSAFQNFFKSNSFQALHLTFASCGLLPRKIQVWYNKIKKKKSS